MIVGGRPVTWRTEFDIDELLSLILFLFAATARRVIKCTISNEIASSEECEIFYTSILVLYCCNRPLCVIELKWKQCNWNGLYSPDIDGSMIVIK